MEEKPLNENLHKYHEAIKSEFLAANDDIVQTARNKLSELLPEATKALERLLVAAESEAVVLSSVKLVFEHTLGKPGSGTAEDELSKLVRSLTDAKSKKSTK